jgi:hypothetical protein
MLLAAAHLVEVVFFTGLIGCVFVVAISWVSVGRDAFSRDTESELHPVESHQKTRDDSPQRADVPKIGAPAYRSSSLH